MLRRRLRLRLTRVYFVAAFGKSVKSNEVNDTVTTLYERVKGAPSA